MSWPTPYCYAEAFIEQGQTDWLEIDQLVTVMIVDETGEVDPVACVLEAVQARSLAFELLVCAEHADRLTRERETER